MVLPSSMWTGSNGMAPIWEKARVERGIMTLPPSGTETWILMLEQVMIGKLILTAIGEEGDHYPEYGILISGLS